MIGIRMSEHTIQINAQIRIKLRTKNPIIRMMIFTISADAIFSNSIALFP